MAEYSLFPFQKDAVAHLLTGKHFLISDVGSGKSAMAMVFAEQKCKETGKQKVLVVTTASKCKARTAEGLNDFEDEARKFCSPLFSASLSSSLSLLSWHKLARWTSEHWAEVEDYVIIWDEVAKAGAGASSQMGKAFLKITKRNHDWAAFTATPGDTWLKFYPYFVATNLVRNKTSFLAEYANIQTYKGFPEVVGWRNEDKLKAMWAHISYAPDTRSVLSQLPEATYRTNTFSKPTGYSKVLKTRLNEQGEFLDTSGALTSELRRQCFTKDKQEWVKDFVENLGTGAVLFYNFVSTGDKLAEICEKALGKNGRVWRIDGSHHEIPTAETAGPRDIVLCQWQSGAEGLNVQFYWHWVGVELCYAYSTFQQAMGRIKRVGQTHPMLFQILMTDGTIEQDILKVLRTKGEFSAKVWCASNNIEVKEEK